MWEDLCYKSVKEIYDSKCAADEKIAYFLNDVGSLSSLIILFNKYATTDANKIYENDADNARYVFAGRTYEDIFQMTVLEAPVTYDKYDNYMYVCSAIDDKDHFISFSEFSDYFSWNGSSAYMIKHKCIEYIVRRIIRILLRLWHENDIEHIPRFLFDKSIYDDALYTVYDYAISNYDGCEDSDEEEELFNKFIQQVVYPKRPERLKSTLDLYFIDWDKLCNAYIKWKSSLQK